MNSFVKQLVDGYNISTMERGTVRQHFGLVSQEPTLFSYTIGENIAYGDLSRPVTASEVVSAARAAQIHDFIIKLPLGYNTPLGGSAAAGGGTQISGGQKVSQSQHQNYLKPKL